MLIGPLIIVRQKTKRQKTFFWKNVFWAWKAVVIGGQKTEIRRKTKCLSVFGRQKDINMSKFMSFCLQGQKSRVEDIFTQWSFINSHTHWWTAPGAMIYSLKHWQKLAIALAGMETHGVKTTTITELGEICLWNFLRHAALLSTMKALTTTSMKPYPWPSIFRQEPLLLIRLWKVKPYTYT